MRAVRGPGPGFHVFLAQTMGALHGAAASAAEDVSESDVDTAEFMNELREGVLEACVAPCFLSLFPPRAVPLAGRLESRCSRRARTLSNYVQVHGHHTGAARARRPALGYGGAGGWWAGCARCWVAILVGRLPWVSGLIGCLGWRLFGRLAGGLGA